MPKVRHRGLEYKSYTFELSPERLLYMTQVKHRGIESRSYVICHFHLSFVNFVVEFWYTYVAMKGFIDYSN